ncbi:MAG: transglutaminase-like domain-containing protein [Planctomycetota bacterium]|jgi:hypothetical protein
MHSLYGRFVIVACLLLNPAGEGGVKLDETVLPAAWTLQETVAVPDHAMAGISMRLGAPVRAVKNHILDAGGIRLQVNVVTCDDEDDAEKVFKRFTEMHRGKQKCAIKGNLVFEFLCNNELVIKKTREILGVLDASPVCWKVKFVAAPLEKGDYMKWNRLFNLLKNYRADRTNEKLQAQISECARSFVFTERIALQTAACPWGTPTYTFSEEPAQTVPSGDVTTFIFEGLPEELGLPLVEVNAEIPVMPFGKYMPERNVDEKALTSETPQWPVKHDRVAAIVKETVKEGMSQKEKVEALLNWRRAHIRFGGDVTGSRHGTLQVIEQGFGRCCDHCDVLITLLRAADIPARLILGWLPVMGGGHYWVEAFIPGEGWLSVDATTSWLGITEDYIPFVISEDGEITYVYWDFPEIERAAE